MTNQQTHLRQLYRKHWTALIPTPRYFYQQPISGSGVYNAPRLDTPHGGEDTQGRMGEGEDREAEDSQTR